MRGCQGNETQLFALPQFQTELAVALRDRLRAEAGQGTAAPCPTPPSSPRPSVLRFAPDRFPLTKPNTSCTIEMPASLRSDGVRVHPGMLFGFPSEYAFSFTAIPICFAAVNVMRMQRLGVEPTPPARITKYPGQTRVMCLIRRSVTTNNQSLRRRRSNTTSVRSQAMP